MAPPVLVDVDCIGGAWRFRARRAGAARLPGRAGAWRAGAGVALAAALALAAAPGGARLRESAACAACAAVALATAIQRARVVEESLVVMPGVGLATEAVRADGALASRAFYPEALVHELFLSEAFAWCAVVTRLALLVGGSDKLVVCFPHCRPRARDLALVYEQAHDALWGGGAPAD
jgi:hypothetical protein